MELCMQNKQECFAWSVGLCQLFKESLVHSMHLYFTVYINFSCWNKASNSIHWQMAQGNSETAKKWNFMNEGRTTPPTRACAVSQLELRAETRGGWNIAFSYTRSIRVFPWKSPWKILGVGGAHSGRSRAYLAVATERVLFQTSEGVVV